MYIYYINGDTPSVTLTKEGTKRNPIFEVTRAPGKRVRLHRRWQPSSLARKLPSPCGPPSPRRSPYISLYI